MTSPNALAREVQAALKARGHFLGTTGPARDGVDGIAGGLTFRAMLAELAKGEAPARPGRLMANRALFFTALRTTGLFRTLNDEQVVGIGAILDAAEKHGLPMSHLAYVLATAKHETGGKMSPNRENLNYSVEALRKKFPLRISRADAERLGRKPGEGSLSVDRQRDIANLIYGGEFGRRELGNTEPGDGWHFRGGGMDHCTGRRNYHAVGEALGMTASLMTVPDLILDPKIAAEAIVTGLTSGRYTGKRLADFLPDGPATIAEYTGSRRCVNGLDQAAAIAGDALNFQRAVREGGWQ